MVLAGCAASETVPPDPLVGRIFRSADRQELTPKELFARAAGADVVYLGEKHDNPRHHELQLAVLRALVGSGRRPAIGFEVFPVGQTSLLVSYALGKEKANTDKADARLRERLGWDGPDRADNWSFYGPLLKLARREELTLFGADLPVPLRARISRVGVDGLNPVERGLLRPTGFVNDPYEALMRENLKAAHCGYGSPEYLGRLYANWVARNDVMATAIVDILDAPSAGPVVVILGAGHTEYNMAVYERVAYLRPGVSQVSLAFREVEPGREPIDHYVEPVSFAGTLFSPRHEYLWFTPRAPGRDEEDLCAAFRGRMQKPGP